MISHGSGVSERTGVSRVLGLWGLEGLGSQLVSGLGSHGSGVSRVSGLKGLGFQGFGLERQEEEEPQE